MKTIIFVGLGPSLYQKNIISVGFVMPSYIYAKFNSKNLTKMEIGKYLLQKNARLLELLSDSQPLENYRIKFNFQRVSKILYLIEN